MASAVPVGGASNGFPKADGWAEAQFDLSFANIGNILLERRPLSGRALHVYHPSGMKLVGHHAGEIADADRCSRTCIPHMEFRSRRTGMQQHGPKPDGKICPVKIGAQRRAVSEDVDVPSR